MKVSTNNGTVNNKQNKIEAKKVKNISLSSINLMSKANKNSGTEKVSLSRNFKKPDTDTIINTSVETLTQDKSVIINSSSYAKKKLNYSNLKTSPTITSSFNNLKQQEKGKINASINRLPIKILNNYNNNINITLHQGGASNIISTIKKHRKLGSNLLPFDVMQQETKSNYDASHYNLKGESRNNHTKGSINQSQTITSSMLDLSRAFSGKTLQKKLEKSKLIFSNKILTTDISKHKNFKTVMTSIQKKVVHNLTGNDHSLDKLENSFAEEDMIKSLKCQLAILLQRHPESKNIIHSIASGYDTLIKKIKNNQTSSYNHKTELIRTPSIPIEKSKIDISGSISKPSHASKGPFSPRVKKTFNLDVEEKITSRSFVMSPIKASINNDKISSKHISNIWFRA